MNSKTKKNCLNCVHLYWGEGDTGYDLSDQGYWCDKR